jgi:hypothetical protein
LSGISCHGISMGPAVGSSVRFSQRPSGAKQGRPIRRYSKCPHPSRERGVAGLHGELRPGRPRRYDEERVAALMTKVLHSRPPNATQWSVRRAAKQTGISKSTVARYFALFGIQPHRSKSFKLSTDPCFIEKVRDVVGL